MLPTQASAVWQQNHQHAANPWKYCAAIVEGYQHTANLGKCCTNMLLIKWQVLVLYIQRVYQHVITVLSSAGMPF